MLYEDFKIDPEDWYDLYKMYVSRQESPHKGVTLEDWKPIKAYQAKRKYDKLSSSQDMIRYRKLVRRLDYEQYRKDYPDSNLAPSGALIREFGSWSNAVATVFSQQELERFKFVEALKKIDLEKIVDIMVKNDIYTKDEYDQFKRDNILCRLPDKKTLMKYFGKWSYIQRLVKGQSIKSIIERYLILWEHIGKKPSAYQCNKHGVEIKVGYRFFGSKEKFYEATKYARRCFKEFIRRKNGTYKSNGRNKEQMAKIRAIALEKRRLLKEQKMGAK